MKYLRSIVSSRISNSVFFVIAATGLSLMLGFAIACLVFPLRLVEAQQDPFLSRRIDQIESRFYTIESRLERVESATRPTLSPPPLIQGNDQEIRALQQQIDSLRTRIGELECGVLKLDERTLAASARSSRIRGTQNSELCRREIGLPVQLSARP